MGSAKDNGRARDRLSLFVHPRMAGHEWVAGEPAGAAFASNDHYIQGRRDGLPRRRYAGQLQSEREG